MKKICEETQFQYLSAGVNNMFKATIIEKLNRKLSFQGPLISEAVEFLIRLEAVPFLREKTLSKGEVVVQLNRSVYKEVVAHLAQLIQFKT